MKYPQIQALVPEGTHFDESAIINEGGYLYTAHLEAVENELATNAPALEQANSTIETHVATIEELNGTINTMQSSLDEATTLSTAQSAKITELQAQVVELGKKPSGAGSKLQVKEEVVVDPNAVVPMHLNDNSPQNQWVDQQMARHSKKK